MNTFMSKVWKLLIRILGHREDLLDVLGRNLFRYQCYCGQSLITTVPEHAGEIRRLCCGTCFTRYCLLWNGDHFSVQVSHPLDVESNAPPEPESAGAMFARMREQVLPK